MIRCVMMLWVMIWCDVIGYIIYCWDVIKWIVIG